MQHEDTLSSLTKKFEQTNWRIDGTFVILAQLKSRNDRFPLEWKRVNISVCKIGNEKYIKNCPVSSVPVMRKK